MILSNVEIQRALDEKRLVIQPEPLPRRPEAGRVCPYDTHAVDLRLGVEITTIKTGVFSWDLTTPGKLAEFIARNSDRVKLTSEQPFKLKPNRFVLGTTKEYVELPILPNAETCLAARIEGKSSRARCGLLIHFTAPTIHPGFKGNITLEMINLGPVDFLLVPDMDIAQLIVEEVKGQPFLKESQFQGQTTPEGLATDK